MASDKGFVGIEELAQQLSTDLAALTKGAVDIEKLEDMCQLSGELHERLVILRHKGREAIQQGRNAIEIAEPTVADMPELKLDLGQPIVSTGQTSLIDAIAETAEEQVPQALNEQFDGESAEDLTKAIGLNQKFMFISQLFSGKSEEYVRTIDKLNTLVQRDEAIKVMNEVIRNASEDEEGQIAAEQFRELIERRFQ
jgi:hypothetical protein